MDFSFSWWYLLYGFLIAQAASLATTLYLHRETSHRSVEFHPVIKFIFGLILWLGTGINKIVWGAVHLAHHANPDRDGDPHSPVLLGFWKVQLGNLFLYQKAAQD